MRSLVGSICENDKRFIHWKTFEQDTSHLLYDEDVLRSAVESKKHVLLNVGGSLLWGMSM